MFTQAKLYIDWMRNWRTLPVRPWVEAGVAFRAGDHQRAAALYRKGLSIHPDHRAAPNARLDLVYSLFKLRKFADAECELRGILSRGASREASLRLARLKLWCGQPYAAALVIREALTLLPNDPELASLFLYALVESGTEGRLLDEGSRLAREAHREGTAPALLELSLVRLAIEKGDYDRGRSELMRIANREYALFEAVVNFGELLLSEDKVALARQYLRRAHTASPEHPKVLTLLAESYLRRGALYQPDFAIQLASAACQNSAWMSPRALHVLARAYDHVDDRASALMVANKAKLVGNPDSTGERDARILEELLENLSGFPGS